jgi:hypothetical protein
MDKIDWKFVSKTEGYISLKKSYIERLNYLNCSYSRRKNIKIIKQDHYSDFRECIGRVMKFSNLWGIDFHILLNHFEKNRKTCYVYFYSSWNLINYKPSL